MLVWVLVGVTEIVGVTLAVGVTVGVLVGVTVGEVVTLGVGVGVTLLTQETQSIQGPETTEADCDGPTGELSIV